jgi:hypothetical protein
VTAVVFFFGWPFMVGLSLGGERLAAGLWYPFLLIGLFLVVRRAIRARDRGRRPMAQAGACLPKRQLGASTPVSGTARAKPQPTVSRSKSDAASSWPESRSPDAKLSTAYEVAKTRHGPVG